MLHRVLNSSNEDSPAFAVGLMLVSLIMLSAQDAMVKLISLETSLWQFQVARALLNLVYVGLLARWFMRGQSLRPKNLTAVVCRSIFHLCALCFFFSAAPFLSLAEMAGGLYTFPLFVVLLSFVVLRERIGPWRLLAVIAGFIGTLCILRPGSEAFRPAAMLPVCAGFCYGCFVITTRRFCRTESPVVLVLGSNLMITLVGVIGWVAIVYAPIPTDTRADYPFILQPEWSMSSWVLFIVIICAFLNTTANLTIGKAYQSAESSFLAPVDYSYLIFATAWGWILWRDIPSQLTLLGMFLIASAGIFVAWRERRQLSQIPTKA